jgi:glycosyltransferase involved in cell wall biosynthesis
MSDPLVTIVIPTHNRAALLARAIESVMLQSFEDWELVVVDDGSTDETSRLAEDIARRLGDRFVYHRQSRAGAGAARNAGIELARGRFVAFLDSDDEFRPTKLDRQMRLFELRPELGLVYSDWSTIDLAGKHEESVFDSRHPMARRVRAELVAPGQFVCGDLFDALLRGYFICTIVGVVRRDVLGDQIRFRHDLPFGEEWLFYLETARACSAGFVDEPLSVYHFQIGSLSRSDKHRNADEFQRLLLAIRSEFPDLRRSQRRVVDRHLARLHRQMACVAYREARFDAATARFAAALRFEPSLQTLWHLGQSLWCGRTKKRSRNGFETPRSQESQAAVR